MSFARLRQRTLLIPLTLLFLVGCRVPPSPEAAPVPPRADSAALLVLPTLMVPTPPAAAALPAAPVATPERPAAVATVRPAAGVDLQPPAPQADPEPSHWSIGVSAQGRTITVQRLGQGPLRVAVIGGLHGGYEGNTVVLVQQMVVYFQEHPEAVPAGFTLYLVPNANPDGYAQGAVHAGRFNGNGVDLNRNWAHDWQQYGEWWGTETVYGGSGPFSEPETRALRDLIAGEGLSAAVFYHSSGGLITYPRAAASSAVLAECYAAATGYDLGGSGSFEYDITGDASGYLREQGVATIDIELTDHESPEWERNIAGLLQGLACWLGRVASAVGPEEASPHLAH